MARLPKLKRKLSEAELTQSSRRRVESTGTTTDEIAQRAIDLAPTAPLFRQVTLETAKRYAEALALFDEFLWSAKDSVTVDN